jgi:Mor family transcriptional regulator
MKKIQKHLKSNPSYFKWSNERLAKKYTCSIEDISNIVKKLRKEKAEYLRNLNF